MTRRTLLGLLGSAAGGTLLGCSAEVGRDMSLARGKEPCARLSGKTIRWIVPNAPGGGYDTESRTLEPFLEKRLDAQIAVENIPGAGGIAGARALSTARADGLTLGMISAPGLMVAAMIGQTEAPRPERDFTILGRLDRSWHVWVTGASSPLRTLEDAARQADRRPLLFSLNEVGSATFVSMSVAADILAIPIELVAGFAGTRAQVLAALRGDVDVVCLNYDTCADLIASGELRPILQISNVASAPALARVAMLGGEHGVARERANALGRDASHALRLTHALVSLIGAGRLIVAPAALHAPAFECLARAVHTTLTDDEVLRVWAHPVDVADADAARASVVEAAKQASEIVPIVEKAMRRLRG